MYIKLIYKADGGVDYVEVHHTGVTPEQNFSTGLVNKAALQGWMTLSGKTLTVKAKPEDLVYEVLREPARYCLYCNARLPGVDDDGPNRGEEARKHVVDLHGGVPSPDPNWPHGYAVVTSYECRLSAEQHAKYRFAATDSNLVGVPPEHIRAVREKFQRPTPQAGG